MRRLKRLVFNRVTSKIRVVLMFVLTDFYFFWFWLQEMDAAVVDGNGTETGHIIVTTIGGKNGQPKQVYAGF